MMTFLKISLTVAVPRTFEKAQGVADTKRVSTMDSAIPFCFSQDGVGDDGADGGGEGAHVRPVEPLLPRHQGPHRHDGQGEHYRTRLEGGH